MSYQPHSTVEGAVAFIEQLRNGGNDSVRLYRLEEVKLEVKTIFKVEVGDSADVADVAPKPPTAAAPPPAPRAPIVEPIAIRVKDSEDRTGEAVEEDQSAGMAPATAVTETASEVAAKTNVAAGVKVGPKTKVAAATKADDDGDATDSSDDRDHSPESEPAIANVQGSPGDATGEFVTSHSATGPRRGLFGR